MSAARTLGAIYLATASVFGVAIALNQHPAWQRAADAAASGVVRLASDRVVDPAADAGKRQLVRLFDAIDPPRRLAHAKTAPEAVIAAATERAQPTIERQIEIDAALAKKQRVSRLLRRPFPHVSAPALARVELRPVIVEEPAHAAPAPAAPAVSVASVAKPAPAVPQLRLAPPEAPPSAPFAAPASSAEVVRVVARLKENLTDEMFRNFSLFLYVSKAEDGPLAQHMYVFDKQANGDLALKYDWPVSTGRERVEFNQAGMRLPSFTPQGYYELDPDRIYRHYTSSQWHQPMPYAMFFNWVKGGSKTGLAIHAATGPDISLLGKRASAGCIRLDPKDARLLFTLIRAHYKGLAPRFAINRRTGTMSNDGILLHDPSGRVELAEGYKVLVFIENYGGKDNVVAALF